MNRWIMISVCAATVGAVALGAGFALANSRAAPEPVVTLSARSTPAAVSGDATRLMGQFSNGPTGELTEVGRLQASAGRAVYSVSSERGIACYAAGPDSGLAVTSFDIIACPIDPAFPSKERPTLDFSLQTTSIGDAASHYSRVEGLAADGFTALSLRDSSGAEIGRIPVNNNVYIARQVPEGVTQLVPVTDAGSSDSLNFPDPT